MEPARSASARREEILAFLDGRTQGVARPELEGLPGLAGLDPQGLRRLMAPLVREGRIRVAGLTKARRYFPGAGAAAPPLSAEGRAARDRLLQAERPPAAYSRPFLDTYQPNEMWYLPMELRRRLADQGKGGDAAARKALLGDLAWNSARLDGAACTREAAEAVFQGEAPGGVVEAQRLLNHRAAVDWVAGRAEGTVLDPVTVQNLHALLTDNLLPDPGTGGRLRQGPSRPAGTTYAPPDAPRLVEWCFRQVLRTAGRILDPYEQAFFLLVHLPYLRPFAQANGCTARLAANLPLLRRGHLPVTFADVPAPLFGQALRAVWEANDVALLRDVFAYAVERTRPAAPAGPDPFRLRHRDAVRDLVREAVLNREAPAQTRARVRAFAAAHLPGPDGPRLRAIVEAELAGLHEGNCARFQVLPGDVAAWKG